MGAVGLLSDTPPIRDMSNFSDWQNIRTYGLCLACYFLAGTVWFAVYFDRFACGELECAASAPAKVNGSTPFVLNASEASIQNQTAGGLLIRALNTTAHPSALMYPNDAGPWLDAMLLEVSSITTVGW